MPRLFCAQSRPTMPYQAFFRTLVLVLLMALLLPATPTLAKDDAPWSSGDLSGMSWRGIGPAFSSGRIGDFAFDPRDPYHFYVAVASGGVWETTNSGTTFQPIFDSEGSYSIGCLTLDPTNPDIVWVGTGENNSQRSVAYGDGIYRSLDRGRSWQNMGLERSMHIGRIIVHPSNSDIVYVAAMGPLWGPGGDRGVYKTTDGGTTWTAVLEIDENTGVVDIQMDPRDPDVIYAASYQRRRHTWTLINGGPGSGIHKTIDGGKTWQKISKGLPEADMGRIGLAISPPQPDTIYAIVEATDRSGGFYRSTNRGQSWKKMNSYRAGSPQYYQEIVADPINPERVYSLDTFVMVTENGGGDWERLGYSAKHVDEHAFWIDPANTNHIWTGNDGGIYETMDRGEHWRFMANLPVTQFYRVAVDYDEPFYNVYGGTQDNNTQGGPSQTVFSHGISNREWFMTLGGDGFKPAIDPVNADIVYSQWQYGNLHRYDRKSGEVLDIQPQPQAGEILKWNWNSPLIISPHDHKRLYYACQKLYRSDDMGFSWTKISEDLSSGIDRNQLEVMGAVWGVDAVAKNTSTSFYGSVVSLVESPMQEGLIFIGTDDGIVQSTSDNGTTWIKSGHPGKVPAGSYVSDIEASPFDQATVFACFDNHKRDDLKPYVFKSTNGGKSWKDITGNLPERGTVYSVAQDHVDKELLFVGTEFGVFFTRDQGKHWTQLNAGIPIIACRDLEIQQRENDLVVATFGRGFFILDDYSPLRFLTPEKLTADATLFPIKDSSIFIKHNALGYPGKGFQGEAFYIAPNPTYGAVITYNLGSGLETLKSKRKKSEKDIIEKGEPNFYPSWAELRTEDRELSPEIILVVRDENDNVVRRFSGPTGSGLHRVAWDWRYPHRGPVNLNQSGPTSPWDSAPAGPLAAPGKYSVTISQRVRGVETHLAGPEVLNIDLLDNHSTPASDAAGSLAFQMKVASLHRAVQGASRIASDADNRLNHMAQAINDTPGLDRSLLDTVDQLRARLADLKIILHGNSTLSRRSEPVTPSLSSRVNRLMWGTRDNTSGSTQTQHESLAVAKVQFKPLLTDLTQLMEVQINSLEKTLEEAGAPYTPGRIPVWDDQ